MASPEQCFGGPQKLPPHGFLLHKQPHPQPAEHQHPFLNKTTAPRQDMLRGPHNIPRFTRSTAGLRPSDDDRFKTAVTDGHRPNAVTSKLQRGADEGGLFETAHHNPGSSRTLCCW
jgi:hypothetical protein